ncbi:MAG: TlpA family protein disulfide reductase [Gemmatimonadetes bacterium]|nr:TlpA family protein disulfide reductase [Gemmatimonadota bacterium]
MPKLERALLYGGLVVGAVLILQMIGQYDDLRTNYTTLRERLQWPHAGYAVPTFASETVDGRPIELGARRDGRQLVFYFSTTCEFCLASLSAWRELTAEASEHDDLDVVGVAVDRDGPIARYRDTHGLTFPITTFPDDKLRRLYRARSVPLITLLDHDGTVLFSRIGVLDGRSGIDSVLTAMRELPATTRARRVTSSTEAESPDRPATVHEAGGGSPVASG